MSSKEAEDGHLPAAGCLGKQHQGLAEGDRHTLRKASIVASLSQMPWSCLHACSRLEARLFQYSSCLCCEAMIASARVPACDSEAYVGMLPWVSYVSAPQSAALHTKKVKIAV